MTTPKFNEDTLSEKPAIEQLKRMKYEFLTGDKLDPQEAEECERTSRRDVILADRLRAKLKELNPNAGEIAIEKAIRQATNIQGTSLMDENKLLHKALVSNISIEQEGPAGRRSVTIKFIDFDEPKNNDFLAVNQFRVKGPKVADRPDIVIFVNGIPLAVIECKSPVARETGVGDAIAQLLRYQKEIPALFRTNQIVLGTNLFGAKYGVIGADYGAFHEWKNKPEEKLPDLTDHPGVREMRDLGLLEDGELPRAPAQQDVTIAALFNKRNFLDIIRNFTVFQADQGKVSKKICRYQQFAAVQRLSARVLAEKEKKGIIWHWQGSGKSLTMVFAALKLRREERRLKNPYFLVVTDRKDLDRQITNTFNDCGFPNPIRAATGPELYRMLSEGVGRTIMTTVQKFRTPPDKPLSPADNIIVLTDEAHRTQYGSFAFNLRKALPNAAFFAFTGTPLDKKDRSTYKEFSPAGESYMHRYGIMESEADKATVPIKYMGRLPSLRLVGGSIDALLACLFPDKSKSELAGIKKQYAGMEVLHGAPQRIERVAMDIVEHYHQAIRPNGLKAMIVAKDRDAAELYKNCLDKLVPPEASAVIMTINERGDCEERKKRFSLTDKEEENLKERFKNPGDPLSFLIVCDKLLTGFDAPLLQAMYLDQRLIEHGLLQAVARTNRCYPGKNYGLVVDYVGIGSELAASLKKFNSEDVAGMFSAEDVEKELKQLPLLHKAAMVFFAGVSFDAQPRTIIQKCLEVLRPPAVRGGFDEAYRALAKSMDFLMPDLRIEPFLKDFKFLGAVREGAKNLYRDERLKSEDLSAKVKALIQAHIAAEKIEELLKPLTITAPDFAGQLAAKGSDKAKAVHLEYALRDTLRSASAENPAFYETLQKRLEDAIAANKKERRDDADLLLSLMRIKEIEAHKDETAKKLGLAGGREFAFFGLIDRSEDLPGLKKEERAVLAKEIIGLIEERAVAEWAEREDIQKEMRREIKRLLRRKGCAEEKLPALTRELIELAQQWVKR
ncbi:MAG: HsdR family type I site-specific deoxyribonuclease [Elusimicrobia bacterium]|nr:HsdR family type I site-specific deoxyribonuclease [Elusimicrobiota bacterium]